MATPSSRKGNQLRQAGGFYRFWISDFGFPAALTGPPRLHYPRSIMALGQDDLLLGRIALHYKLVTQDQLTQAAARQDLEGGRLGAILVGLGLLTPGQLDKLLAVQRDYLAKQQLQGAAAAQAQAPAPEPARPSWRQAERRLDALLAAAVERRASDVHVHT